MLAFLSGAKVAIVLAVIALLSGAVYSYTSKVKELQTLRIRTQQQTIALEAQRVAIANMELAIKDKVAKDEQIRKELSNSQKRVLAALRKSPKSMVWGETSVPSDVLDSLRSSGTPNSK